MGEGGGSSGAAAVVGQHAAESKDDGRPTDGEETLKLGRSEGPDGETEENGEEKKAQEMEEREKTEEERKVDEEEKRRTEAEASLEEAMRTSRRWCLDLCPRAFFAAGETIDVMVRMTSFAVF